MHHAAHRRVRSTVATLTAAVLLTWLLAPHAPAAAHKGHVFEPAGLGIVVESPASVAGFLEAVQWAGTPAVEDEPGVLAYGGTSCTPASYAGRDVAGKIVIVDSRVSADTGEECLASTFFQKVRSAQTAGAIGFIQIPAEGAEWRSNATAVNADIPALEVRRTPEALALRDAVLAGDTVDVRLVNIVDTFERMSDVPCVDGMAGPFPCDGVDLLGFVPAEEIDSAGISDIWGWTHAESGREFVMMGKTNGTAFFEVTDPTAPVYLGALPNPSPSPQTWHDVKVFADHAFIVSESEGHGMMVFDLTRLLDVADAPATFDTDAHYRGVSASHNIEINTDSGFAYIVGGNTSYVPDQCLYGLHMVDVNDPTSPRFSGCYFAKGGPGTLFRVAGPPVEDASPAAYVHDTQCVIYDGPDTDHTGKEICLNSAENKVVIADVTNKMAPTTLGSVEYPNTGYTHQGWLTEDSRYFIVNDELDEETYAQETRTLIFDVSDLDNPVLHHEHWHTGSRAITHNNYVRDGKAFLSNYSAGLRVLDLAGIDDRDISEIAFFDTFPTHDDTTFDGTWSNYPFFESKTIAVSGRMEGLFLLRLQSDAPTEEPPNEEPPAPVVAVDLDCEACATSVRAGESGSVDVTVTNTGNAEDSFVLDVTGAPERTTAELSATEVTLGAGESTTVTVEVSTERSAKKGSSTLTVTATSAADDTVSDAQDVTVEVTKGAPSKSKDDADDDGAEMASASGDRSDDATVLALAALVLGAATVIRRRVLA